MKKAAGDVDRVVERVAVALTPALQLEADEVRRLAGIAVDAMLPDDSTLTEHCAVRFRRLDGAPPRTADVSLVGNCELAEHIARVGPDEHVHRFVLVTPWRSPVAVGGGG